MQQSVRMVVKRSELPLVKAELLRVCSLATILDGWDKWLDRATLLKYWRTDLPLPVMPRLATYIRRKEVFHHIQSGSIEPTEYHDILRPYTPDFFAGLKLSGCLYDTPPQNGLLYKIIVHRPKLIEDLEKMPHKHHLSKRNSNNVHSFTSSVFLLPTESRAIEMMAGVVAGAKVEDNWLIVPKTENILKLFDRLPIALVPGLEGKLRLSPFYGALIANAGYLPSALKEQMLGYMKAGGCPLIPAMVWEVTFGGMVPRSGILPYLCGPATLKRRKWGKNYLHSKAIEHGITSTSAELRGLLEQWVNCQDVTN